ncbi:MAG TPA: hypothetical protein VN043_16565 [Rhodanobacter sp.]|nr:hypothetical protein [Rhodanobacter sp.]
MKHMLLRGLPVLLLALASPMLAHAAAVSSAVSNQVSVAGIHADMAISATDLETVHLHLHHVINCLEGPDGKDFDAKATNPCHGMGLGALVDARDDPAVEARLHLAQKQAEQGVHATTLDSAHADAQQVFKLLQHH